MIRFDEASDVRQIIKLIVGSMSPSQKTNPQTYALRLRHMLTKEVSLHKILLKIIRFVSLISNNLLKILWMPPDTSMTQVMAHILNPTCSNADCPNADKASSRKLLQQQQKTIVGPSNSVWKAELRVRYIPKNLKELYEKDRTTCHFYFDQVNDFEILTINCLHFH